MVKIEFSIVLAYEILEQPADFIFNVHASASPRQMLKQESFQADPAQAVSMFSDPLTGNRYARGPRHCACATTLLWTSSITSLHPTVCGKFRLLNCQPRC